MKRLATTLLILAAGAACADGDMGVNVESPAPAAESSVADAAGGAAASRPQTGTMAAIHIALKAEAPVRGSWFTLGDIAEISGPEDARLAELRAIQMGHAPLAGAQRLMTAPQVEARLRAMGVTETVSFDPAVTAARVTPVVKPLAGDAVVRFGHDFLAGKAARPGARVTIEDPETPRALSVPDVAVTFRAETSARKLSGLVPVTVEAWAGERRLARLMLSYRVHTVAPVARANRALEPGTVIGEADLDTEDRDLAGMPDDALTARETLIGLRVVRAVAAGAVIRRDAVAQALQVKRGSQVTLIAHVGTVEARAMAQSKDDGANGDVVTVVNLDSKRLLKARVVDPGLVEAVMP